MAAELAAAADRDTPPDVWRLLAARAVAGRVALPGLCERADDPIIGEDPDGRRVRFSEFYTDTTSFESPLVQADYNARERLRKDTLDAAAALSRIVSLCAGAGDALLPLWPAVYQQAARCVRIRYSSWPTPAARRLLRLDVSIGPLAASLPPRWFQLAVQNYGDTGEQQARKAARKHRALARLDVSRPRSRAWLAVHARLKRRRDEMTRLQRAAAGLID